MTTSNLYKGYIDDIKVFGEAKDYLSYNKIPKEKMNS